MKIKSHERKNTCATVVRNINKFVNPLGNVCGKRNCQNKQAVAAAVPTRLLVDCDYNEISRTL